MQTIDATFEKVSAYDNINLPYPERKTHGSAGYDFVVAEDIVIPSYQSLYNKLIIANRTHLDPSDIFNVFFDPKNIKELEPKTLEEMASLTKNLKARPTLVPTGMKCKIPDSYYLELSVRSSCPFKHWLILANGVGIIDSDYYNNPDNEGHIFYQMINLSPFDILLHKGDIIGQGILKPYCITKDDKTNATRAGGFGSTSK